MSAIQMEGEHETAAPASGVNAQSNTQLSAMRKLSADLKESENDTIDAASTVEPSSRLQSKQRGSVASSAESEKAAATLRLQAEDEEEVEDEDDDDVSPTYRHGETPF